MRDWLPSLLQSTDSFFPSGTFSHSFGLEGMTQLNAVHDAQSLRAFLENQVIPSLQNLELPQLRFAFVAARRRREKILIELDAEIRAAKPTRELRQASAALGAQRLHLLRRIYPHPVLERFAGKLEAGEASGNLITVLGLQMVAQRIPLDAGLVACYYGTVSAIVAASMKLIRIGQTGCQEILTSALSRTPEVVAASRRVTRDRAGAFNPLLDIASARHETAYTRLFIS
jgi:urease accessory protein